MYRDCLSAGIGRPVFEAAAVILDFLKMANRLTLAGGYGRDLTALSRKECSFVTNATIPNALILHTSSWEPIRII